MVAMIPSLLWHAGKVDCTVGRAVFFEWQRQWACENFMPMSVRRTARLFLGRHLRVHYGYGTPTQLMQLANEKYTEHTYKAGEKRCLFPRHLKSRFQIVQHASIRLSSIYHLLGRVNVWAFALSESHEAFNRGQKLSLQLRVHDVCFGIVESKEGRLSTTSDN